jgi:hypothetical protein
MTAGGESLGRFKYGDASPIHETNYDDQQACTGG